MCRPFPFVLRHLGPSLVLHGSDDYFRNNRHRISYLDTDLVLHSLPRYLPQPPTHSHRRWAPQSRLSRPQWLAPGLVRSLRLA
jgi:hypothetical protein